MTVELVEIDIVGEDQVTRAGLVERFKCNVDQGIIAGRLLAVGVAAMAEDVDDLADACIFLTETDIEHDIVNVGSGEEISIGDLARLIAKVVGFDGKIEFNSTMPDGTPRKLMDSGRMRALGWAPKTSLEDGIRSTYEWALANEFSSR